MDLSFLSDTEKLKALPRRLKIVAIVILADLVIIGASALLSDDLDERAAMAEQLRTQLGQLRQQSRDLRHQIDEYPDWRRRYDAAVDKGILHNLDQVKVVNEAQDLAGEHHLVDLRYRLEPQDHREATTGHFHSSSTLVTFEGGGLLDTDAMAFWDEILVGLPSHYHVVEASLERVGEVDSKLLADVDAGRPSRLIRLKMSFQWRALHAATDDNQ